MATTTLSASALLRRQFGLAHQLLDTAITRLSSETVYQCPPNAAGVAGARYAQVVVHEDLSVNSVLAAGAPLSLSTWAGRTGLSELPPLAKLANCHAWVGRVRLNLAEVQHYAQAVYAATDAYLAALPDGALDLTCDEQPERLLSALLLTLAMRRGEIACLLSLTRLDANEI
ncbi:MAG TPA: hypothetical protein VGP82_20655 [Ktedonobacterales bacterium]|nr:hypothetical protein [Ktedonobacterales bacterium]